MTTPGDYPILGAPTITLASFRNVLTNANSPAAPEAIGLYNAAIQYGVDPAVLLAVFQHESSFGKAGIAVGRNNGFGLRFYGNDSFGGTNKGGWYTFPTWTAGAQHVAALLAGPKYGQSANYNTVRTFTARYAPSSDGNNPASYGATLARNIATWTGSAGVPLKATSAPKASTKAAPKAAPAAAPKAAPAAPRISTGTYALVVAGIVVLALVIIVGSA